MLRSFFYFPFSKKKLWKWKKWLKQVPGFTSYLLKPLTRNINFREIKKYIQNNKYILVFTSKLICSFVLKTCESPCTHSQLNWVFLWLIGSCLCLIKLIKPFLLGIDVTVVDSNNKTVLDLLAAHPSAKTREIESLIYGEF